MFYSTAVWFPDTFDKALKHPQHTRSSHLKGGISYQNKRGKKEDVVSWGNKRGGEGVRWKRQYLFNLQ